MERKLITHGCAIKKANRLLPEFFVQPRNKSLSHIPDVASRHYVLQALGLMWAVAFAVAIGSYTFLAVSVIGHSVLIAAAAITVATWTAATAKPDLFVRGSTRQEQDSPKGQINN